MTNQELLAVLDMSEDEQIDFLYEKELIDQSEYNAIISSCTEEQKEYYINRILADLAFRKRDEVCSDPDGIDKYKRVLHLIYRNWLDKQSEIAQSIVTFSVWLIAFKEPIDMIIAALIAKGKNEN